MPHFKDISLSRLKEVLQPQTQNCLGTRRRRPRGIHNPCGCGIAVVARVRISRPNVRARAFRESVVESEVRLLPLLFLKHVVALHILVGKSDLGQRYHWIGATHFDRIDRRAGDRIARIRVERNGPALQHGDPATETEVPDAAIAIVDRGVFDPCVRSVD